MNIYINTIEISWHSYYWSGSTHNSQSDTAWVFALDGGHQDGSPKSGVSIYAIAVRNVVPIPEPATMVLFGLGVLGLAGVSRRKKILEWNF